MREQENQSTATSASRCEPGYKQLIILPRELAERIRGLCEEPLLKYPSLEDFILNALTVECDLADYRLRVRLLREAGR